MSTVNLSLHSLQELAEAILVAHDTSTTNAQQVATALVAAARARLDASELQEDRGSKRDVLARTPPPATAPERPPPPLTHARGLRPAGVRASRLH